ncbi:hypothetical protein BRAS3843_1740018 [Bradyrhizobium sp. STM 3843]|nr:hypothetical protein BRAS3843_1740018 [Bradyrhizobium sp. STM 3843]
MTELAALARHTCRNVTESNRI